MPDGLYLNSWLVLALFVFGAYGFERAFIELVRLIDRRTRGPKGPTGFVPPK